MAMDLLRSGVHRSLIALWLGHESVETTQIYLDASLASSAVRIPPATPSMGAASSDDWRSLGFLHFLSRPGKLPHALARAERLARLCIRKDRGSEARTPLPPLGQSPGIRSSGAPAAARSAAAGLGLLLRLAHLLDGTDTAFAAAAHLLAAFLDALAYLLAHL